MIKNFKIKELNAQYEAIDVVAKKINLLSDSEELMAKPFEYACNQLQTKHLLSRLESVRMLPCREADNILVFDEKTLKTAIESFSTIKIPKEFSPTPLHLTFSFTGTMETFSIPMSGAYKFIVKGAKGADSNTNKGGSGAIITAIVEMKQGDQLDILVGGMSKSRNFMQAGGAGGTFISLNGKKNPFIIAGGGGGSGSKDGKDASLTEDGSDGRGSIHGKGGISGECGQDAEWYEGCGGAGFYGNSSSAKSFVNGGNSTKYAGLCVFFKKILIFFRNLNANSYRFRPRWSSRSLWKWQWWSRRLFWRRWWK